MRIVFMGSPRFAVPVLDRLVELKTKPVALFCQPDQPAGRGLKLTSPPTKLWALEHGVPVFQPEKLTGKALEDLRAIQPDLLLVVAYGKILPRELLALPPLGCINIHASLLPELRGAAPIQWALLRGDTKTGIALQSMVEELDAGPILISRSIELRDENFGQLHDALSALAADAFEEFFRAWDKKSRVHGVPQDASKATFAPKIKPEHRWIDWNQPGRSILNQIRAFSPAPGARTESASGELFQILDAGPGRLRLKPGAILSQESKVLVGTGDQAIELFEVKGSGGRRMKVEEYLKGRQMPLAFVDKHQ